MRNKKNKSAADEFDDNRSCCKYYRRWEPLLNESPVVLLMPNRSDYYAALRHFFTQLRYFNPGKSSSLSPFCCCRHIGLDKKAKTTNKQNDLLTNFGIISKDFRKFDASLATCSSLEGK